MALLGAGIYFTPDAEAYDLDGTSIKIIEYNKSKNYILAINLHDNEDTCVKAAKKAFGKRHRIIELKAQASREIRFRLNGSLYRFDPNRIFSEKGIMKTLKAYGHYSRQAYSEVEKFADELKEKLEDAKAIIGLHNNDHLGFSVNDYRFGGTLRAYAAKATPHHSLDPDDFFFVNSQEHYTELRKMYNVVLQNEKAPDDGSLSQYCARKGIPYINVETQEGKLEKQVKMLLEAEKLLKGK